MATKAARKQKTDGDPGQKPAAGELARTEENNPKGAANDDRYIELRRHLDQRLGSLMAQRTSWWSHWQEIAKYIIPRRYTWLVTPNAGNRGSPINQSIIDNTGTRSLRILAAGMMSGMTSPGQVWFRLVLNDQDLMEYPPVKAWLDEVASRVRTVLAESNFYTSVATMYEDLGAFGTAALIIYEDFYDIIRCYNSALGEYMLANSNRLSVDTFYRQFVLSSRQIVQQFPIENTSPTVQQAIRSGGAQLDRELIVAHAIEPNPTQVQGALGARGMPYREVYWEYRQQGNRILSQRGFHECPFIAPRWAILGNDPYGRSPGMDALGDIKQLQVEQKRKGQAIDKNVNPPMVGDVALKNQPASLLPGGVTYVPNLAHDRPGFKPAYEMKLDLGDMREDIKDVQTRVKQTFYEDIFLMIAELDSVRTATEIDERKQEKLIQLGPVLERFENEALDPALERIFNVMLRKKLLPPIPRELRGQHIRVEYMSMLSQAQKAAMTAGLERFAAFVGRFVSVDPTALDNVDIDEMCDQYAELLGVPSKVVRPYAQVLQLRAQRAKQQQAQAIMSQTLPATQAAKNLSETDVGGGVNAMQAMLGQGPMFGPQ